jgi:hypothetical protein
MRFVFFSLNTYRKGRPWRTWDRPVFSQITDENPDAKYQVFDRFCRSLTADRKD